MPARNKTWMPLQCKEMGIDNFINKPFAPNQLLNLINSTIEYEAGTSSQVLLKTA
jgi:DNA-binding response OmpR family regulator